jgi:exosome complex RNA-binding protein Rrp4
LDVSDAATARVPAAEVEEMNAAVVRRRRFLRVGSVMVAFVCECELARRLA